MRKEQKEQRFLKDLGIDFDGHLPAAAWPKHLYKTFKQVHAVRSYDLPTFCSDAVTKLKLGIAWDYETGNRAKTIAATCRALVKEDVSEMEWRLRIEELFLARFRSDIECREPFCRNRLWRSEIEAIVESPGTIATSLEERRKERQPCRCPKMPESPNIPGISINNMFSSRSDEMVFYNPFEKEPKTRSKKPPWRRRPDRIVGLKETGSLDRRLDSIARWLQDAAVTNTIRETTECTILNSKSGQLLFPFLVIEAKSESGKGFNVCGRQTALPIWKMLKIQEELQSQSKRNLDYGGPLVWYIAYRGEEWRLYGCYTVRKESKVHYKILELWSGLLSDDNGALQALLIVDYIFDWARDIYSFSIIRQLKALAEEPCDGSETRLSRMPTDNDISSLAGSQQKLSSEIDNWISNTWDHMTSPQEACSADNFDVSNPELIHGVISTPSTSDSKPATANSSEQLGQEPINKNNADIADSPSIESPDPDTREDEAVGSRAAIADSVLTPYQTLATQEPLIAAIPTSGTTAASPLIEDSVKAELGSGPAIPQSPPSSVSHSHCPPRQPTPTLNIYDANDTPHPSRSNTDNTIKTHTLALLTPAPSACTPPQMSPSLVSTRTPSLSPARTSAPSPRHSVSAAASSPKRSLDLDGDDAAEISSVGMGPAWSGHRAKRVKPTFTGPPPGVDVVVID